MLKFFRGILESARLIRKVSWDGGKSFIVNILIRLQECRFNGFPSAGLRVLKLVQGSGKSPGLFAIGKKLLRSSRGCRGFAGLRLLPLLHLHSDQREIRYRMFFTSSKRKDGDSDQQKMKPFHKARKTKRACG